MHTQIKLSFPIPKFTSIRSTPPSGVSPHDAKTCGVHHDIAAHRGNYRLLVISLDPRGKDRRSCLLGLSHIFNLESGPWSRFGVLLPSTGVKLERHLVNFMLSL